MELSRLISSKRFWAMIFFVVLLVVSQVFLHQNLSRQASVGKVVNLAGKQRVLSQRILSFSCIVTQTNSEAESTAELLLATSSWYDNHLVLLNGNVETGIPPPDETLEAEMIGLNELVISSKGLILEMVDLEEDKFLELKTILDTYLPRMDLAVTGLAVRASGKVKELKIINGVTSVLLLIVGVLLYSSYELTTRDALMA